jgi:hypothetical protein
MHNLKVQFSGTIEEKPERKLDLRLRSASVDLAGWDKLLPSVSPYNLRGKLGFDLSIHKSFAPQGGKLDIRGNLDLKEIGARGKKNGQFLEGLTSKITFHGKEAEVEKLQLRLGSSQLNLQGKISDLKNPTVRYTLRSPRLNLADLTNKPEHRKDWVKDLIGAGEFQAKNGNSSARARISSGEGVLQKIAYKRLQGELHWRNDRVNIKSMTFQALGGSFKGSGQWERETDKKIRFTLHPQIDFEARGRGAFLQRKTERIRSGLAGNKAHGARRRESPGGTGLAEGFQSCPRGTFTGHGATRDREHDRHSPFPTLRGDL